MFMISVMENEIIKHSSEEKYKVTRKIDFLKIQRRAKRSTEAAFGRSSKNNCYASACKSF